ncbi:helix-turn-helix domain-containing protein [Clostridium tertium]|uniref:helix-turn-helix domain-containing protein n=1 Tax=Clostridium tertium TaxID=1559 RepID=UPI0023B29573|nr:helix-turn-helix domain-containing protein [Clostridium tertium]
MKELSWKDYVEKSRESSKELEDLVKSIRKTPGESVPYNYVHMAEMDLNNKNEHSIGDLKIIRKAEDVAIVDIIDENYIEDYRENEGEILDIKKLNNGEVEVKIEGSIYTYELFGDGPLFKLYTATEAALKWGLNESTVRKSILTGRFHIGTEYRKAGKVTLITHEAMERVYGKLEEM